MYGFSKIKPWMKLIISILIILQFKTSKHHDNYHQNKM